MSRLPDEDLTVLVDRAAREIAEKEGHSWEDIPGIGRNAIREQALPFIFHGTKALTELGYRKPRRLFSGQDVLGTHPLAVILAEGDRTGEDTGDIVLRWKTGRLTNGQVTYFDAETLIEDYDKVAVLWEPTP